MGTTLYDLLPREENLSSDNLLGRFLDCVAGRRLTLYRAQKEASVGVCHGLRNSGVGNRVFPLPARPAT
ncbi:MAG: hypothetical protein AAB676_12810, partial [Verrucomicrobiota bacterium]